MNNFKVIGCGAAGNKAVMDLMKSGYDEDKVIMINSTRKDIPNKYKNTIIFGPDSRGGCGKERTIGKQMFMNDMKTNKIDLSSLISSNDTGVVLVGSTEGGTGSSIIPIIAKFYKEIMNINVICVFFFGFQEDTRGLQNSIELAQELTDKYTVIAISNMKFLKYANNNFEAEQLANNKFVEIVNILNGSIIKPGKQVIDDADMYKIIYTPGYMMLDTIPLKDIENKESFNNTIVDAIDDSCFISVGDNPGLKREALIFDVPENCNFVDYQASGINKYGSPYEKFTNLSVCEEGETPSFTYIMSGMNLPIDEITKIFEKYTTETEKVNKKSDNFFDSMQRMKGNPEDSKFDMLNSSSKKNKRKVDSNKLDSFFADIEGTSNDDSEIY